MWYPLSYPFNFRLLCFILFYLEVETQQDWLEPIFVVVSLENIWNVKVHSEKKLLLSLQVISKIWVKFQLFPNSTKFILQHRYGFWYANTKKLAQLEWYSFPKCYSNTDNCMLVLVRQSLQWMWYPLSYPFNFRFLCFILLYLEVETQQDWLEPIFVVVSLENKWNVKVHSEKMLFHEL